MPAPYLIDTKFWRRLGTEGAGEEPSGPSADIILGDDSVNDPAFFAITASNDDLNGVANNPVDVGGVSTTLAGLSNSPVDQGQLEVYTASDANYQSLIEPEGLPVTVDIGKLVGNDAIFKYFAATFGNVNPAEFGAAANVTFFDSNEGGTLVTMPPIGAAEPGDLIFAALIYTNDREWLDNATNGMSLVTQSQKGSLNGPSIGIFSKVVETPENGVVYQFEVGATANAPLPGGNKKNGVIVVVKGSEDILNPVIDPVEVQLGDTAIFSATSGEIFSANATHLVLRVEVGPVAFNEISIPLSTGAVDGGLLITNRSDLGGILNRINFNRVYNARLEVRTGAVVDELSQDFTFILRSGDSVAKFFNEASVAEMLAMELVTPGGDASKSLSLAVRMEAQAPGQALLPNDTLWYYSVGGTGEIRSNSLVENLSFAEEGGYRQYREQATMWSEELPVGFLPMPAQQVAPSWRSFAPEAGRSYLQLDAVLSQDAIPEVIAGQQSDFDNLEGKLGIAPDGVRSFSGSAMEVSTIRHHDGSAWSAYSSFTVYPDLDADVFAPPAAIALNQTYNLSLADYFNDGFQDPQLVVRNTNANMAANGFPGASTIVGDVVQLDTGAAFDGTVTLSAEVRGIQVNVPVPITIAAAPDITPPAWVTLPEASLATIGATTIAITLDAIDDAPQLDFFLLVAPAGAVLTDQQIVAGKLADGTTDAPGFVSAIGIATGTDTSLIVSGLDQDTPYQVYAAARDLSGNIQVENLGVVNTLLVPDTAPPVFVPIPTVSDLVIGTTQISATVQATDDRDSAVNFYLAISSEVDQPSAANILAGVQSDGVTALVSLGTNLNAPVSVDAAIVAAGLQVETQYRVTLLATDQSGNAAIAPLGVHQTRSLVVPGGADTNPPFWTVDPAVIAVTDNAITVRATALDDEASRLDYYLAESSIGDVPTAENVKAGVQSDGVTPLLTKIDVLDVARGIPVTVGATPYQANTPHQLYMVVDDGTFSIIYSLGVITTTGAGISPSPLNRFNFRDEAACAYSDWLPFILPFIDSVPEQFVFQRLNEIMVEFCQETHLWQYHAPAVDVAPRQEVYEIALPDKSLIAKVLSVRLNGLLINPSDADRPVRARASVSYLRHQNRILLVPEPTQFAEEALELVASLKPTFDARTCERFLFDDWRETIVAGVLGALYMMRSEDWFSAELALPYQAQFKQGKNKGVAKYLSNQDGMPHRATGDRVIGRRAGPHPSYFS